MGTIVPLRKPEPKGEDVPKRTVVVHGMGLTIQIPGNQVERVQERTYNDMNTYGEQFGAIMYHVERQYSTSDVLHVHLSPGLFEAVFQAIGATAKEYEDGSLPADNRVKP
jgi:hypothetical protein